MNVKIFYLLCCFPHRPWEPLIFLYNEYRGLCERSNVRVVGLTTHPDLAMKLKKE
jgi:hypothetical protein